MAAEHERSTAKGRPYEEAVFDAVDAIAAAQGDDCDAVGDLPRRRRPQGRRAGRASTAAPAPPRGRIVFEAKNSQVPQERRSRSSTRRWRSATPTTPSGSCPSEDQLPARAQALREVNGDKLFVVFDPEDGSRLALEVAYSLARARVLMAKGDADGLDAAALRAEVERALGAMEDVRRIKQQLTHAANGIEGARAVLEELDRRVRLHLGQIDALLAPPEDED